MPAPELFGRYRAVRRLGVGAFASVWLARDEVLDGPVAVKVLADNWSSRGDVRERFVEEARMLRRADSDRVVRVHDIGELDDGRPYFVMTYADRGTLADRLTDVPMPAGEALWFAAETAEAVAVLHARGIIHRDVKPSNVLLRSRDVDTLEVLVSDLGLAKAAAVASGITLAAGTPGYMPPEQADGIGLTRAADVYALGALTYRLLAGRLPRPVSSPFSVLETADDPVPGFTPAAGIPLELEAVLRRALARDPAERQVDALAFVRALRTAGGALTRAAVGAELPYPGGPQAAALDPAALDPAALDPAVLDPSGLRPAGLHPAQARDAQLGFATTALAKARATDSTATILTGTRPWSAPPPVGALHGDAGQDDRRRYLEPAGPAGNTATREAVLEPSLLPAEDRNPTRARRRRSRSAVLLLPAGLTVAVLLAGALVLAAVRPDVVGDARAIVAGDRVVRQGPLTVTVPEGWSQRTSRSVPIGAAAPTAALTVSPDVTGYRSLSSGVPGVYLGLFAGDRAAAVRSALDYAGCAPPADQVRRAAGWSGRQALRRCTAPPAAGGTTVLTWVGADSTGAASARTLVVEVKTLGADDALARRVLASVSVGSTP